MRVFKTNFLRNLLTPNIMGAGNCFCDGFAAA